MYSQYQYTQPSAAPSYQYPAQQPHPASSYPSSSYPPAYPNQYAAPPPTANPQHMPPHEFRQWFLSKLSELVVNQKTIIHNLAFIANDQAVRMPQVVAESIETHIRRAHPQVKLPAWYLLDSIAKNIGSPYTQLFAKFVTPVFLDSYYAVDLATRSKMEEMLVTWRTGGRGGTELFGVDAQAAIEKGVWSVPVRPSTRGHRVKARSPTRPRFHPYQSSSSSSTLSRLTGPTKSQVLTELEVILAQKTRAIEINPYDDQASGHVDTLVQLRNLVQTSAVSPQELSAIATQLRNLARTTASAAPPLPPMVPPPQPAFVPQASYSAPTSSYHAAPAANGYRDMQKVSSTPPTTSSIPAAQDISALFKNLVKAGVVTGPSSSGASSSSLPLPSLASLSSLLGNATGLTVKSETESSHSAASDPHAASERDYERRIMSMDVSLTTAGIQKEHPRVIPMLYDHLSLQCKQCAQRFADDGPASKKRYEDHLDLHFKQNLRNATASTSTAGVGTMGRGYTRSWFVGKEDWIHDITRESVEETMDESSSSTDKGKGRALSPSANVNSAEREAKLRASFVVIPAGDETKGVKCPLCKERLASEFMDEEEEWVWRNAVSVKGKIYHATCHADAVANAARLRHDGVPSTGRSRSATPDGLLKHEDKDVKPSLPAPSPLAGLKRKTRDADDESTGSSSRSPSTSSVTGDHGVAVKVEETDSPRPAKKQALAAA